jgi:mRNA interferase HigB
MRVISRQIIDAYIKKHAETAEPLLAWFFEAQSANWKKPQDIRDRYSSASFLPDNTVVFNIKGNKYRLTVKIAYNTGVVNILAIQTHAEYSR